MRLLWLAGHHFDPPDTGLFRYSKDIASALVEVGVDVHFIGHKRDDAPLSDPRWTLLEPCGRSPLGVFSTRPFNVEEVWDADYKAAVQQKLDEGVDAVLFDHLRTAGALDMIPADIPVVYLSQNHETTVKQLVAASDLGFAKGLAMRADAKKIARLEQQLCDRAAVVSYIAPADRDLFASKSNVGADKLVHVPPVYRGVRRDERTITAETPRRVVIINNVSWHVKMRNTEELLEVAGPELQRHGIELAMIGAGFDEEAQQRHPTVNFLGFVPDLAAELDQARLGVVYEAVGGGLKMKSLDYVFNRVPLVALTGGAEGLPVTNDDYLEVTSPQHFVEVCLASIDDTDRLNDLHERALRACEGVFEAPIVGGRIVDAISKSLAGNRS